MSRGKSRQLTTTSYALLGLLAIRPMSAYELTKQAVHTIGLVAAHAESGMYAELRRLDAGGLIAQHTERVGHRTRTVYHLRAAGRQALTEWLAVPADPPELDFAAMVKVLLAEQGTVEDLRATIEQVLDAAATTRRAGVSLARPYLAGTGLFPERSHVNVLVWRFLFDLHGTIEGWASWALEHISSWQDTAPDDAKRAAAVGAWETAIAAHESRAPAS